MTTPLTKKDSQQIAREAEADLQCGVFSSQEAGRRATLKNTRIILSAIERAVNQTRIAMSYHSEVGPVTATYGVAAQPQPSKGSPASGERSELRDNEGRSLKGIQEWEQAGHDADDPTMIVSPRGQQQGWTPFGTSVQKGGGALFHCSTRKDAEIASLEHNAELAAAWQEHDDVVDALDNFSATIKQLGARNQQLNKQLAAEREKVEALQGFAEQSRLYERKLLSAQAAIEKAVSVFMAEGLTEAGSNTLRELRTVDLSALHEHDAKVQEPLMEALEWAWSIIANAGGGDWQRESKNWRDAAAKWRDEAFHPALAKVEEQ